MKFHPSRFVLSAACKWPWLAGPILWLWGKLLGYTKFRPHWVFVEAANAAGYRAPFWATMKNGQWIKVAVNDVVGQDVIRTGWTEPESVRVISKLLKPGAIFFDIGAHVGQFTLVASKLVGSEGQVHSFEPDPESFRWLAQNLKKNRIANVFLNQVVVTDRVGYREFHLAAPENMGSGSITPPRNPSRRTLRVPSTSIAEYCQTRQIHRVDFMKIDVEGAEIEVLTGGALLFNGNDRPILHIEFNERQHRALGRGLSDLSRDLTTFGYYLLRMTDEGPRPFWLSAEEPKPFNVLALPKNKVPILGLEVDADGIQRL